MKSNILLVGLDYDYVECVAKELSGIFDMRYLDIKGLISYNLIDEQQVLDKAGVEYYKAQVHKIVLGACEYENAIINIPYDLFLDEKIEKEFKKTCLTLLLNLDKQTLALYDEKRDEADKNTLALIAYDEYTQLLIQKTTLQIESNCNIIDTVNNVLDKLKNINLSELKWILIKNV